MITIDLKPKKANTTQDRFLIKAPYEMKQILDSVGARGMNPLLRYSSHIGGYTAPCDPTVIGLIKDKTQLITNMTLTPPVRNMLAELSLKQGQVFRATEDCSELFPGDGLWSFQRATVRFMETIKRGIIGHEMGTGKTVIACTATARVGAQKVLVIVPNNAKWSWARHLEEWCGCPEDIWVIETKKMVTHYNQIRGNRVARETEIMKVLLEPTFMLILNYEQVSIHHTALMNSDYDVIILDEAHRIKNRQAKRTKAISTLSHKAEYFWALTGTPFRNNYDDIWTLLNICDPNRFTSYWNFVNMHMSTSSNRYGGVDILGLMNKERFNKMISSYMFRKTKEDVMPDLPPKIYHDEIIPMDEVQQKFYRSMEEDFIVVLNNSLEEKGEKPVSSFDLPSNFVMAETVGSQLMKLRQICLSPALVGGPFISSKLEYIAELVDELKDDGEQFLVFSSFRMFVKMVSDMLKEKGVMHDIIMGGTKSTDREKSEVALREGGIQAIVGTVGAMGESMNLQTATTVIFSDIDWVPAVNQQAEDRIHRGTITTSPRIIRIFHPETVDEDIRSVCKRKERMTNATVGQMETIRALLKRRHGET